MAEERPHRVGGGLLAPRGVVHEQGDPVPELGVEARRFVVEARRPPPGSGVSTTSLSARGPGPTRSKNAGSTSRTASTMAETTATVSRGQSPVRIIRHSRCSTMPETVCTIEVKAPTGIT